MRAPEPLCRWLLPLAMSAPDRVGSQLADLDPLQNTVRASRCRGYCPSWNPIPRSEEHTSELQSHSDLVCRLLLEKKKTTSRQARRCDRRNRDTHAQCP